MQFNILILDIERRLKKFKFQVIFVILASFSCRIFKVYFIFKSFFFQNY